MTRLINVEKSKYIQKNIEIYTANRVGQYSKFLDKTPFFITYLHINSAESTSDVGTGSVAEDVGPNSPIRFNRINNLPTYNLPELKPEVEFGENGYDIELDFNDAVLLPNTVKPSVGDYIIIVLPNMLELCFRVNGFNYNTIQSNDFYTYSGDLKFTGKNLINRFKSQIVEEYETIFENIGTDDKCFIRSKDVDKIQSIAKIFEEMRGLYKENFFDETTGTFVCKNNEFDGEEVWLYDKYLEKFIMDSEIFFEDNKEESVILSNADIDQDMHREYYRTLQYAVLNRTLDFLQPYQYYYQVDIQKRLSPFIINHINCKSVNLLITRRKLIKGHSEALIDGTTTTEYYPQLLLDVLLYPEKYTYEESGTESKDLLLISFEGNINDQQDIISNPEGIKKCRHNNTTDPDEIPSYYKPDLERAKEKLTYLDKIIYDFLTNRKPEIDRKKLIPYFLRVENYTYRMIPLVLYIILKYYQSFFEKEEL